MEKQTVTIYDVAREAAVSMATVSRVVNGNPNVKPATRKKVLEVIERLDYRPNAVARGLASKKTTTVGVIIPDVTNAFFAQLALGIDDIASMYKYNIILANSDENGSKELQVVNTLLAKQVDGIIFMGNKIGDDIKNEFKRAQMPVVVAGSMGISDNLPSVSIDYVAATKEAVSNLLNRGQKVALVTGPLSQAINGEYRVSGYKQAVEDANQTYDEELVFETNGSYKAGYDLAASLKDSDVTAAFVGDDELAAGLLNGLTDRGVKVPSDFEVTTTNDTKYTEITRPKMSSVTQPLYDIGAVSMRLLTKLMNSEEVDERNIILPYGLIKRDSTK
ncbi:catabolite control protein A [Paucilactobacillus suebicus]|uniref:Catabolite control protein A n=1 Tax=Paucilactobacillus suebicus DSM 5007 = KCTC 3549 TaxID=1423807 RepID=A0A0R1WHA0_9LACO|nr:catabolite control protein A [Paucilactobacillus suebicus]KRM13436.1 catabolite control protein A [Paucilactobacillus suebicus DSM 5007 = KCTC 3549]